MHNNTNPPNRLSHNKTPSLRDLMLGKKTVKSLPDNFFERVLELEIKLKKGFSMDVLQELVNYYSVYLIILIYLYNTVRSRILRKCRRPSF